MPEIKFNSDWLRAKDNVYHGDYIRFLDVGTKDKDDRYVFLVGVIDKDTRSLVSQKKFSLNRTNFKAVAKVYGTNSDNWLNKEMRVAVIQTQNQHGEIVPAVRLTAPGSVEEGFQEDAQDEGYEGQLD